MENQSSQRIHMLDVIRGTAIILVVLYHFLYNLEWLFSMHISAFHTEVANFLHFCLLATIITVSGICTGFSRNIFRRGSMLLIAGTVITMFTSVFLPDQQIVFGVLSFFGTMMILYGFVGKYLQKLPWQAVFAGSILLALTFKNLPDERVIHLLFADIPVPEALGASAYLYPLGIVRVDFYSTDYFPLLPWGFIFLAGTALGKPILGKKLSAKFYTANVPFLSFCGRHSLLIYLLHQPVLFGIMQLVALLIK